MPHRSLAWIAMLALPLAACGSGDTDRQKIDTLDAELMNAGSSNAADPAMTAALQDQIMVDPGLTRKANADAIRPPTEPVSGALPPTDVAGGGKPDTSPLKPAPAASGACPQCDAARAAVTLANLAARQGGRTADCATALRYSNAWANRLPADVPLYPDARVIEAAGVQDAQCSLRAVSFATAAPMQRVLDYYYTHTAGGGFAVGHQANGTEHVLGGTRKRDAGAFTVFAKPRGDGGSDVDLLANNGR